MIGTGNAGRRVACGLTLCVVATVVVLQVIPAAAQTTADQVSLREIGYTGDLVLKGAEPEARVGFPIPAGGIEGGVLTLRLAVSPTLPDDATVRVAVAEQPVAAATVAQLRRAPTLEVPIGPTAASSLPVQISGSLGATDGTCLSPATAGQWIRVQADSGLALTGARPADSLRGFLEQPGGRLAVTGLWDTAANQAASANLVGALQYAVRNQGTDVMLAEDLATRAAQDPRTTRPVKIVPAGAGPVAQVVDGQLQLSATPTAATLLTSSAREALTLASTVDNVAVSPTPAPSPLPRGLGGTRLSLTDLGPAPAVQRGPGPLSVATRFTVGDLRGWPADLSFNLHATLDPPRTPETRGLLRVSLNGVLVAAYDPRGESTIRQSIPLAAELLQPENSLEVVFVQDRPGEACGPAAGDSFTGQVVGDSNLTWTRYGDARGVFPELMATLHGAGSLFLPRAAPADGQAAARLLGTLNRYSREPLLPMLAPVDRLGDERASDYRLVVGPARELAGRLVLPLDLSQPVAVTDGRTDRVLLRGQADRPLVAVQYVPGPSPLVAVSTTPDADDALLGTALVRVSDPTRFLSLQGNVLLADRSALVALNLGNGALAPPAPEPAPWQAFAERYRWILILPLGIAVGLLWLGVYRGVGRPPPTPERPTDDPAPAGGTP